MLTPTTIFSPPNSNSCPGHLLFLVFSVHILVTFMEAHGGHLVSCPINSLPYSLEMGSHTDPSSWQVPTIPPLQQWVTPSFACGYQGFELRFSCLYITLLSLSWVFSPFFVLFREGII